MHFYFRVVEEGVKKFTHLDHIVKLICDYSLVIFDDPPLESGDELPCDFLQIWDQRSPARETNIN